MQVVDLGRTEARSSGDIGNEKPATVKSAMKSMKTVPES